MACSGPPTCNTYLQYFHNSGFGVAPCPSKPQGKTRREKLLLDVSEIMHRGLHEATQPSCITQHRATRLELLNFVSAEGFTPLHYVCNGRVVDRHAAAAVLARWQERASAGAATAPGGRSSGVGGIDGSGGRNALVGGPTGNGSGGSSMGTSIGESLLIPVDGSTDRVKILTWLLSESEVDPKVRVPRGATTLHMAAALPGSEAGADLVRLLVHNGGVNLDALDSPAIGGDGLGYRFWKAGPMKASPEAEVGEQEMPPLRFSALHYALQEGRWESANLLLAAGASVAPEGAFLPCVHVACLAAAPASLVESLLEGDGRPSDTAVVGTLAGPHGVTPLFLAATAGSADLVELLLSRSGHRTANVPILEDIAENETATMVGVGGDCAGPSANARGAGDLKDVWTMEHSPSDGRSPLHAAAAGGHGVVARALLNAELVASTSASRGSLSRSWLNTPDKWGNTPLDVAVSEGHWECAERLAAATPFDVRLAVEKGPSSALIVAERANMGIVDEGLGDASTLCALRESNKLVMTLLKRLHDAVAEAAIPTVSPPTEGAEASTVAPLPNADVGFSAPHLDDLTSQATKNEQIEDASAPPEDKAGQFENEAREGAPSAPRSTPYPVVHHLHPCFAEGVLYSNAKGIFVPDTPERRRQRRESRQQGGVAARDDRNRAAVIIQSRARQAGARRAVAERKRTRKAGSKQRRRSSVSARRSWSDATDQEKAAVLIQSQARQARARAEMARIRDQRKQQQRRSSKQRGEVGVVVVKAAG